jgi:hypothetical protein
MALSHFDFVEALTYLDRLQPASANDKAQPDRTLRTALMTALIVAYWRPFTLNDADGQTARRLPEELLAGLSPAQRHLHDKVGTLRNQQFAHTDPEPAELTVEWNVRDQGYAFPVPVSNVTRSGLTAKELSEFRGLLAEVSRRMFEQYAALGEQLLGDSND